jgi:hypothetical protein
MLCASLYSADSIVLNLFVEAFMIKLFRITEKKPETERLDIYILNDLMEKFQKNEWDFFEYIRSEIKHEHDLLTSRVTWYITCQSFLLTVYGVTFSRAGANWFSNITLPVLAIFVTILSFFMIHGATTTISMWCELRLQLTEKYPKLRAILISRWHDKSEDLIHRRALLFPKLITLIFAITWIVIGFVSFKFPWLSAALKYAKP